MPNVQKYSFASYFYNVISKCFIRPIQSYLQLLLVFAEVDGSKNRESRAFFSKASDLRYIFFTIDCYAHSWQIQKKRWAYCESQSVIWLLKAKEVNLNRISCLNSTPIFVFSCCFETKFIFQMMQYYLVDFSKLFVQIV